MPGHDVYAVLNDVMRTDRTGKAPILCVAMRSRASKTERSGAIDRILLLLLLLGMNSIVSEIFMRTSHGIPGNSALSPH
jgi:hypothetical protein